MFTSTEWKATKFARTHDGRLIGDVVLDKEFWKSIVFVLKGAFPLMKVLRLVDSDDYEKPPMGLIYEAMDQAKERIQRRMLPHIQDQSKIVVHMDCFTNKRGFFGKPLVLATMNQKTPTYWWDFFGDETPELKRSTPREEIN
ncbi:hypothetical protein Lal_00022796 [Lupinus albus]|nr:hypothetical protein Lal_00022796 [Lupinus albus]